MNAKPSQNQGQGMGFDPTLVMRPAPVLMSYYFVTALLMGPAFPIVIVVLWFRYLTLRYRFDDEGVRMSVGLLFKREVNLTYRRIQDIHVTRGFIQRWFGLATVSIQTASGSATPEIKVEGLLEADELRDHLYSRMRGGAHAPDGAYPAAPPDPTAPPDPAASHDTVAAPASDEALAILRDIREALRGPAAGARP
jgi:putative membrane protein